MASFESRSGRVRAIVLTNGKKQSATFNTKSEAVLWAAHKESGLAISKEQGTQFAASGRYLPASLRPILERYRGEVTPTKRSAENEAVMLVGLLKHEGVLDVPCKTCGKHISTIFVTVFWRASSHLQ